MTKNSATNSPKLTTSLAEIGESLVPHPHIAPEGWLKSGLALGIGGLAALGGKSDSKRAWRRALAELRLPLLSLGLLTAYAYRDPERQPIGNAEDYFYAPADGRVFAVQEVENENSFLKGPAYRLEFVSHIVDVPILRVPIPGRVQYIYNNPAQPARLGLETPNGVKLLLSFKENSYNWLRLPAPLGDPRPVFLRAEAGQDLPMVGKFALRGLGRPLLTTLYVPRDGVDILCRAGQHVQAGMSVIGRLTP